MADANVWKPITDLPKDWHKLASAELGSLGPIWLEQSEKLQESAALRDFNERLSREWAIETGIIENLYTIDRGITQVLIEHGIAENLITHGSTDRPPHEIIPLIQDQKDVVEGLFAFVKSDRDISVSYLKELHQAFTRHQDMVSALNGLGRMVEIPLEKGVWKKLPNNPTRPDGTTHFYCPPEHVQTEIERLVEFNKNHEKENIPAEINSAWLHHRFAQIHPFQDGNGRVARALASLVFLRAGWFPLVIHRDRLGSYIDALEEADTGDLGGLVRLFSDVQKEAFLKALSISEDLLHGPQPIQEIIQAAADRLMAREKEQSLEFRKVFELSSVLEKNSLEKLTETALDIQQTLKKIDVDYFSDAEIGHEGNDSWFHRDILTIANLKGYFADTRTYGNWVRLRIREKRQAELVFSFHSIGVDFVGLMAVSAFMQFGDRKEGDEMILDGPHDVTPSIFQFSYNEEPVAVTARFHDWLSAAIINGLDNWRRQI